MSNVNKVMLYGNLADDPKVHPLKSGAGGQVTTFSLATNRDWKNRDGKRVSETMFHKLVAFGKLAEITGKFLKKGSPLIVFGRLNNSSYMTAEGGKRFSTEVVLEDFSFLPKGKKEAEEVTA